MYVCNIHSDVVVHEPKQIFGLTISSFFSSLPKKNLRGSKADMAAAASGGEVPPGDEERIYDNEQLPAY